MKLTPLKKTILVALGLFILVVGSGFVYYNVIVPWPYRHELKTCLDNAEKQPGDAEIKSARNTCFRTYPHFN